MYNYFHKVVNIFSSDKEENKRISLIFYILFVVVLSGGYVIASKPYLSYNFFVLLRRVKKHYQSTTVQLLLLLYSSFSPLFSIYCSLIIPFYLYYFNVIQHFAHKKTAPQVNLLVTFSTINKEGN
jgi:hypothetical protein